MLTRKVLNMKKLDIELKAEGKYVSHSFLDECPEIPAQIDIINAGKSQYSKGWDNYAPFESADGENWKRTKPGTFDGNKFSFISNSKFISWYPPYPVENLKKLSADTGIDIEFNNIPVIKIGNKKGQNILMLARQNPGESISSYFLDSFIRELVKDQKLLDDYYWIIYPIVNVSGLNLGNHRLNCNNIYLNRKWNSNISPISEIKKLNPSLVLDIHGDEVSKINTIITHKRKFFEPIAQDSDFVVIESVSGLKRFVKSVLRSKKININFGKTAEKYFNDKNIPSATIELSAHKNNLEDCQRLGKKFIKSFAIKNK